MANTSSSKDSSSSVAKAPLAPLRPTRYACFVIPSRLALFVFSFVIFAFAIGFVVVGWIVADKLNQQLLDIERLALFLHILIYFLLALFTSIGVYSVIQKSMRYTILFSSTILGQLVFNIASGALCLYLLFRGNGLDWDSRCMDMVNAHPDVFLRNLCERSPLMKGLSTGLYVFMWLMEIVSVILANQYLAQLREEAAQMEMLNPPLRESFYC